MTVNVGYLTFMIAQCHGFICTSFFFVPFQSLFRSFWLSSWFVLTFVSSHTLASLWFLCWSSNKCIQLPISYLFSVKSNSSNSELFKNQLYWVSPFQTILILVFHSVWQNPLKPSINMALLWALYQLCYWYYLHTSRI